VTVPQWLLERYAVGEVDEAERAQVEADPDLPAQLAALKASDDDVRLTYDKHTVAQGAQARSVGRRRPGWQLLAAPLAVAAAVVVAVQVAPDGHRAKGGLAPELHVYRQGADGSAAPVASGDLARPGEVLQVEVVRGDDPFGWVLSVDGRGQVTVHNKGALAPGTEALPEAYALDDAPAFEHFFVVACDEPIPRDEVVSAARVAPDGTHALLDLACGEAVGLLVRKP
jgi:hypothetical protein